MRSRPPYVGATRARAKAHSSAPTGASSTSTTPACARTCSHACLRRRLRAARCRESIVVFEDHTVVRATRSPAHVARGPGRRTCAAHVPGAARFRAALTACACTARCTDDEARGDDGSNVAGISHAMMAEHYALPGPARRRHRLAHAAQRRARLRRLRRRHHRHGQRLRHRRGAHDRAATSCASSSTGRLPAGRHRQGRGAAPARRCRRSAPAPASARCSSSPAAAVSALSTDERATLTNMTAELGGFTGIVAPDEETVRFLRERRGVRLRASSRGCAATPMRTTRDVIAHRLRRRCRRWWRAPAIRATACRLRQLDERVADRHRLRRLVHRRQARGLRPLPRGAGLGRRARPARARRASRCTCNSAPTAVRDYCIAPRLPDRRSRRSGAQILQPSCGACANCGPGSSTAERAGDGERDQPQLPRPLRPGQVWLRKPADGRGERHRRQARVIRGVAARLIQDRSIRRADALLQ